MKRIFIFKTILLMLFITISSVPATAVQQDEALLLFAKARSLALDGEFLKAIAGFENVIELYPESRKIADSHFYIGYCKEQLSDRQGAFDEYKFVVDNFDANLIVSRKSLSRAVYLARSLSREKGDRYSSFLNSVMTKKKEYDDQRIIAAINLAEEGDWSGKDVLIEGLFSSSVPVQVKISEVLAPIAEDKEVSSALRKTLVRRAHPLVRINAINGLARNLDDDENIEVLTNVVKNESNETVRTFAARVAVDIAEEPKVREALETYILRTNSPSGLYLIGNKLITRYKDQRFEGVLKKRLRVERNPVMKLSVVNLVKEELMDEESVVLLEDLSNSPEVEIRVNALRSLKDKTSRPEVEYIFVEKLKTDPAPEVKVTAISGLKHKAGDEEVRSVFISVMNKSEDPSVVTSSVKVLSPVAHDPEVREALLNQLGRAEDPAIIGQVTRALMASVEEETVQKAIIDFLNSDGRGVGQKVSVLNALDDRSKPLLIEKLDNLFSQESDERLIEAYQRYKESTREYSYEFKWKMAVPEKPGVYKPAEPAKKKPDPR